MKDKVKTLNDLRRQCSRREYCTGDVLRKAERALDGDSQQARSILQVLIDERYVDDRRYAAAYAREKSAISGWGPAKIRYMLSAKGLDRELIAGALEDIDAGRAESRLVKLLETKRRALKDDPQWRLKLVRFAVARGYSYDQVKDTLETTKL